MLRDFDGPAKGGFGLIFRIGLGLLKKQFAPQTPEFGYILTILVSARSIEPFGYMREPFCGVAGAE